MLLHSHTHCVYMTSCVLILPSTDLLLLMEEMSKKSLTKLPSEVVPDLSPVTEARSKVLDFPTLNNQGEGSLAGMSTCVHLAWSMKFCVISLISLIQAHYYYCT